MDGEDSSFWTQIEIRPRKITIITSSFKRSFQEIRPNPYQLDSSIVTLVFDDEKQIAAHMQDMY